MICSVPGMRRHLRPGMKRRDDTRVAGAAREELRRADESRVQRRGRQAAEKRDLVDRNRKTLGRSLSRFTAWIARLDSDVIK